MILHQTQPRCERVERRHLREEEHCSSVGENDEALLSTIGLAVPS
ncbi:hypothetical protein [Arcanobacterium canis]